MIVMNKDLFTENYVTISNEDMNIKQDYYSNLENKRL